jgi:hypothetical protein
MTEKFSVSFKKDHLKELILKLSEDYITDWSKWMETEMGHIKNCVFIDDAAFHVNLKRNMAWSKVWTRTEVVVPKTRAKTTTMLRENSPHGVVNIKVR